MIQRVSKSANKTRAAMSRWKEICRALRPFAQRHVRRLAAGALLGVAVISIRLSLPWLFKAMLKPILSGTNRHRRLTLWLTESTIEPTLLFGGVFLLLLIALGLADFLERLKFAQFAIGMVRDLRARAFQSAMQIDPQIRPTGPGELVARLIGDTARVKEGLKGFLVHVVTNGALMLGASAVLIWVDPLLGAIFAVAVFLVICTTLLGTVRVYDKASRHRAKEGRLAESIQHAWRHNTIDDSFALVNQSSGEDEASVTRLQGRTTWMVHIIFGLAVLLLMWQGMRSVATRNLQTGDMLIFMMYLLMMRSPIVQLARQGTRSGKIMACAGRIEQVLRDGEKEEAQSNLPPLQNRVLMDNVKVRRRRSEGGGRRLLIESLVVPAGARIAVVGAHGSGKTTLLQVLSGRETPKRGNILWDDIPILEVSTRNLDTQISRLSQEPAWPKQPLFKYLGLKDSEPDEALLGVLRATGAWSWIKHLGGGLTTRLASESLSVGQRRSLALARALLTPSSLLLLDDPTGCSGRAKQDARLRAILSLAQGKAVMVAMRRLTCADLFDRVLELDRGRIVFNGTPADYLAAGATADVQTDSR